MRKSVCILLGLLALLVVGAVAAVAVNVDLPAVAHTVKENAHYAVVAPIAITSSNITEAIINDLKVKFGVLKVVTVDVEPAVLDDDGKEITPPERYQFLVRRPDKGMIQMLTALGTNGEYEKFNELAIKNLVVGGDMDSLNDGIVYLGVVGQLKALIEPSASFLSKA